MATEPVDDMRKDASNPPFFSTDGHRSGLYFCVVLHKKGVK